MRKLCRFKDCNSYGHINAIYVPTQTGEIFELEWCSECGRVQSKFK